MKRAGSMAFIVLMAMLAGCSTHIPYQGGPFIKWGHEGEINSFDKASVYTATFISKSSVEEMPIIEFQGKQLPYDPIGLVQDNSDIKVFRVRIPGPLNEGTYTVTAKQTVKSLTAQDKLTMHIFPTRLAEITTMDGETIRSEEEIAGLIKSLSKGDAIEFCAIPSSGHNIPSNQFRTFVKGTINDKPIIGLHVHFTDNYYIGPDAKTIGARIIWQDPNDQSTSVQLFPTDGTEYLESLPTVKRPRIICGEISRIVDEQDPVFFIACEVKAPIYTDMTTNVKNVTFEIKEQNIKGYKVIPYAQPQLVNGKWQMGFKLDGLLPVPRGTGGTINIKIKASAVTPVGETSPEAVKSCKFNVVY